MSNHKISRAEVGAVIGTMLFMLEPFFLFKTSRYNLYFIAFNAILFVLLVFLTYTYLRKKSYAKAFVVIYLEISVLFLSYSGMRLQAVL